MERRLSEAQIGEQIIITRIEDKHKSCLMQMGIVPGTKVEIQCICFNANFLIKVKGVKIAMRKKCCENIYVEDAN